MGHKPSRPIISADVAIEQLDQSEAELRRLFKEHSHSAAGMSRRAFMNQFGKSMSRFGTPVEERLFQVLGAEGDRLQFEEFVIATFVFSKQATEEIRLRLIFNAFDLNGDGFINKKEFKTMTMFLVKGDQADANFNQDFKQLSKVMVDTAMALYDTNRDGKLSYEEWVPYARDDDTVQAIMTHLAS